MLYFMKKGCFYSVQLIVLNLSHFSKMSSFHLSNLFGRVAVVKEEQKENAPSPIVVTLFGMVIDFKEEQDENP